MVSDSHEMMCTERTDATAVFSCLHAGCGRQVALDLRTGRRTTVVEGDWFATHAGGIGVVVAPAG